MFPPEIGPDLLRTLLLLSLLLLVIYSNFACLLSSFHTISIVTIIESKLFSYLNNLVKIRRPPFLFFSFAKIII